MKFLAIDSIARAFTQIQPPPQRSILFISTAGEEKGLLGSQYYSEHPLYPLTDTLANINLDGLNVLGPTQDIILIGFGQSTLEDVVEAVASEQKRTVKPDAVPENGSYFSADHFNFAKQGVPSLFPMVGLDFLEKPAGWGLKMLERFFREDYHKPSDTVKPDWDLRGAVEDLQIFSEVGYRIANAKDFPTWKRGFRIQNDQRSDALTYSRETIKQIPVTLRNRIPRILILPDSR